MKALLSAILAIIAVPSFAQPLPGDANGVGLSFIPDYTFKGSNLGNWHGIGAVDWRAENGEMIGTVKEGVGSGLLALDHSYQDAAMHLLFKCSDTAEAGIVFRLEKTGDGLKGVLVSVKDGDMESYGVTFDTQGKELHREILRSIGSDVLVRMAPPAISNAPPNTGRNRGGGNRASRAGNSTNMPLVRPDTSYRSNEWNQIESFIDLNITRSYMNDGAPAAVGAADDNVGKFGPIALYAGGVGEIHFKEVGYKDVSVRFTPVEKTSSRFRIQRISDMYYSWGTAAGDFNNDGILDIVAGPYIYFGPDFTTYREVYPAAAFNPSRTFTDVNCEYAFDFNGDKWTDILTGPPNAYLYINPKGESRRWDKYLVVQSIQSEITVFKDIDGSGIPALIYCKDGTVRYAKPDPADPTKPWIEHIVSEKGYAMSHGIGVGDINGDGRMDIINPNGWWEQPASGSDGPWPYHPEAFARYGHRSSGVGGAVMAVYDVNGDGLNDVVTSLNAHGFGLAWFEQKRAADGKISFIRHMISDDFSANNAGDVTFSEMHGSTVADVDGDGIPDFIVGKRYWSHLDDYFDPDPYGDPVLYCYRTVRNPKAPGGAEFVPELIHNRSGAGSDVLAVDLNKDGAIDIVTSTDRGTFIFWNTPSTKSPLK